ncbi:glycogen(starch) synthase [Puccinia graminis f. sp. tritici]|uniref:Glycogen(Starch) synthase n=1 Tax=Puccinia graminis f. sp. tritici TaxID=56615 RepID=A0A5B0PJS3_PUCGR|nr:glycogen(starch) synthase [Puccinia graminis f. sp. tritici]KAA1101256.1 glycogen(starch) synthase [Puccinia graminis f. sp. tritici]
MSESKSHINPLLLSAATSEERSEAHMNTTLSKSQDNFTSPVETASPAAPLTAPSAALHSLAPPPELSYALRTQLHDAAQRWALEHGYAIEIQQIWFLAM